MVKSDLAALCINLFLVTRVSSQGTIRINFDVVMKDFSKQGYRNGSNKNKNY